MPPETVSASGTPPIMSLSFVGFEVLIVGWSVTGFGVTRNTDAAGSFRDKEEWGCLVDAVNGLIRVGDLVEYCVLRS